MRFIGLDFSQVLVSFDKQFIYTKTIKTAGSSVEDFFKRYCLPPGDSEAEGFPEQSIIKNSTGERITDYGIVGAGHIGGKKPGTIWSSHMSAGSVRNNLGDEIFQKYFKFCVIRNPFDKVVSRFFLN